MPTPATLNAVTAIPFPRVTGNSVQLFPATVNITAAISKGLIPANNNTLNATVTIPVPVIKNTGFSITFLLDYQPISSGAQGGGTSQADPGGLAIDASATLELRLPANPAPPPLSLRSGLQVSMTMAIPALISGRPTTPVVWSKTSSTFKALHSPVPITKPPPPIPVPTPRPGGGVLGARQYRWLADDANGGAVGAWNEHNGRGPTWVSAGPYAPTNGERRLLGGNGQVVIYSNALHFRYTQVSHMWADFGDMAQPFTFLFAGIILSYPTVRYGHYLLDQGLPSPIFAPSNVEHKINDGYPESGPTGYRNAFLWQRSTAILDSRRRIEDGVYVRCEHNYVPQPRVFYGIFNGGASVIGARSRTWGREARGTIDVRRHRHFVMGRRTSWISRNLASHMAVFEVRFYDKALSPDEINGQYNTLAASYNFNAYGG